MNKCIEILIKTVFGEDKFYPQCKNANIFAKIAKTKTLTKHNIAWIEELGFRVRYFTLLKGKPVEIYLRSDVEKN